MADARIVYAFLVLSGSWMDRWAGIVAGAMGCIAIWWMPYCPIWPLTYIASNARVIYAPDVRDQALRNHPEVGEDTPDRSNTVWLRLRTRGRSRRWSCVTFG